PEWIWGSTGVDAPPMLGDLASGADPYSFAGADMVEELDEPGDPARSAGQAVVQCQRHQLRMLGALSIHDLKAVNHVAGKILASRKAAVFVEPVVIGLKGIRNDQMSRATDRNPIRQLVIQRVAVIEKAAELNVKPPRIDAGPAGHPADRPN